MGKKNVQAINSALAALEKRFKEPVIQKMTDIRTDIEVTPSGRPDLDVILGGGYGVGKIVEIYSEEAMGKSGLALEAIKECQSLGGIAAFIDAEHALNTEYCEQIGVDVDALYLSQPSFGEQAFEAIRALIGTGQIDLIVVDSVSALVPKAELEGESGQAHMAVQARMMSQGMKLIVAAASDNKCTVIFLNQLRSTLAMYGPPKKTTGGNALKFYATQRLELKRKGWLKEGEQIIGFNQQIKVVKNKLAPPFQILENDIVYGKGVDALAGLIEACVFEGIMIKKGAFYYYKETRLAQGAKKLRIALEDNPDLVDELRTELNKIKK